VRNKLGILVETYSYASFEDRIRANYWFLEEAIDFAAKNGDTVRNAVARADRESVIGQALAVRQQLVKLPDSVAIVTAQTVAERNPYVPDRPMRKRVPGGEKTEMMGHYATTAPTETSIAPRFYVMPLVLSAAPPAGAPAAAPAAPRGGQQGPPPGAPGPGTGMGVRGGGGGSPATRAMASVVDRLEAHGIGYFKTEKEMSFKGERFAIETSVLAEREYQGTHKMRTLTGKWETVAQTVPAGSLVVPMDQPLARLAFILFDPRSDDGFMAWNILDPVLSATPAPQYYPVLRTMEMVSK
jgi:hypothetical protein